MSDFYDKWYKSFTATMGELEDDSLFESMHSLIMSSRNTFAVNRKIMEKSVDVSWVDAIEQGMKHLDTVLRNPRVTIEDVGEVVPIALSRKITVESVKHLAQHTDLIQDYDPVTNTITPSKVLNVHKEESMMTYENKFINTLVDRLYVFIIKRYEKLQEVAKDEEVFSLSYNTDLDDKNGKQMSVSLKLETTDSLETVNESGLTVWERVEHIKKAIEGYKGSTFCQTMGNVFIRPPVMRTNAIMKNVDLKACLTLWQFIEGYDKVGYEINVVDTAQKLDEDYMMDFYNLIALNFLLFRSYTHKPADKKNELKTAKPKAFLPKFLKRFNKDDMSKYDVMAQPQSLGESVYDHQGEAGELNIALLNEIDQVFALEKEYIRVEQIRTEVARIEREKAEKKKAEAEERRLEALRREAIKKAEEERAERERIQREETERLKREWEERQKAEAEERERLAKEAAERAERERQEAEERRQREYDNFRRAQLTAERLEQERLAAEEEARKLAEEEANLTPEELAERERIKAEKAAQEKREKARAERLRAEREIYRSRDFRTIYLEYSRSPWCVIRRFFITLFSVIFRRPYVPDVDPKYYRAEYPKKRWFERPMETAAERDERMQMKVYYNKYAAMFPYDLKRTIKNIKWKMKKKTPLTDAQKDKIRKSLVVMTPEEEKAENARIKALFKEYHVGIFTKIKRKFKQWRENKKLRNERVNEEDDKK